MTKLIFSFFLIVLTAFGASEALVIKNGAGVSVPGRPNTAAYTASTNFRFVLRIHNCTSAGSYLIGGDVNFNIGTDCNSIYYASGNDGSAEAAAAFPSGATDVVAQVQRINGGQQICVEVWRTDTGAYNVSCTNPGSPGGAINVQGQNLFIGGIYSNTLATDIDYVRWYSTTVPLGTIPSPNAGGDLGDWELDGSGNDSSGNGLTLSAAQNGYISTPLYAPIVAFANAGNCFLNNAAPSPKYCVYSNPTVSPVTTSYSPNSGDTVSYAWSQVDGPSTGVIVNGNTPNPTISGLNVFGQYDFQVAVKDTEGNTTSGTLTFGVVSVNSSNTCLVSDVPVGLQYLVGPLTPWGSSCDPWPWYDVAEVANANVLMATYAAPVSGRTAMPGTITVNPTQHNPTITGSGTHFTTDCAGLSYAPNAPSCNGALAWLWWNAEGGTGNGRYVVYLSVTDNTHATVSNMYNYGAPAPYAGMHYSIANPAEVQIPFSNAQNGAGGSYSWDYYDNVIAFYRLYYRTGITAYLTYARQLADDWWLYALDHGYASSPSFPRLLGIPGMMARAIDGHPERWAGIENEVPAYSWSPPSPAGNLDFRETGYGTSFLALETALDPNVTGSPSNQQAYCNSLSSSINNFWSSVLSFGYKTLSYSVNQSYPTYGYEVEPWQLPITATGFRDAYRAASGVCNDTATASAAMNDLIQTVTYVYQYGAVGYRSIPAANGGGIGRPSLAYMIGTPATGETAHQPCATGWGGLSPCTNGTVSIANGGLTVTGVGTNFTSMFGCNGTDYIGIVSEVQAAGYGGVHLVVSCQSDTQLTVASTDPGVAAVSGSYWQESPADASTDCAPSMSAYCYETYNPDQSTDAAGIYGWVYQATNNGQYKLWGDDMFSAAYGGPAGGPGTLGSPSGPMSAAYSNNNYGAPQPITDAYGYISALPSCNYSSPPCGGVNYEPLQTPVHWGKDFGIGSGWAGAMDNYLAYRLMGSQQCGSSQPSIPPATPPQPALRPRAKP